VITLYLDTSSLVKLYIEQSGSDEVRQDLGDAEVGATSLVAYAEARAAFARLRREGSMTAVAFRAVKRDFDADWSKYLVVELRSPAQPRGPGGASGYTGQPPLKSLPRRGPDENQLTTLDSSGREVDGGGVRAADDDRDSLALRRLIRP
jgi:hypothetical protein